MERGRPVFGLLCLVLALLTACGTPSGTPSGASPAASPASAASPAGTASPATTAASGDNQQPCTPEAASTEMPSGTRRLVIGTGGTGGVFYPYGGGLARILTEHMPNTEVTAEVTGGSVDNMKLIQAGDADIGFSTVDSAYDAIRGVGSYQATGAVPACALAVLYPSFLHVVALESSGITSVAEMKGKRISVGSAGSSTEDAADRLLQAAGVDPQNDITRDNLSVAESVAAMKDQKIDAFFWIGGLPTAAVTDLFSTPNLRARFIDVSQYVEPLRQQYGPVYTAFTLPANTYPGVTEEVPGIGINNILFVNANMPEPLAYEILQTIFDHLDEVKAIHPEAQKLSLESAVEGSSIPFHPGAIRFYRERGVWKEQS